MQQTIIKKFIQVSVVSGDLNLKEESAIQEPAITSRGIFRE